MPYDPKKKTCIMTYASRIGLGSVMCQEIDESKPIGVKKLYNSQIW